MVTSAAPEAESKRVERGHPGGSQSQTAVFRSSAFAFQVETQIAAEYFISCEV